MPLPDMLRSIGNRQPVQHGGLPVRQLNDTRSLNHPSNRVRQGAAAARAGAVMRPVVQTKASFGGHTSHSAPASRPGMGYPGGQQMRPAPLRAQQKQMVSPTKQQRQPSKKPPAGRGGGGASMMMDRQLEAPIMLTPSSASTSNGGSISSNNSMYMDRRSPAVPDDPFSSPMNSGYENTPNEYEQREPVRYGRVADVPTLNFNSKVSNGGMGKPRVPSGGVTRNNSQPQLPARQPLQRHSEPMLQGHRNAPNAASAPALPPKQPPTHAAAPPPAAVQASVRAPGSNAPTGYGQLAPANVNNSNQFQANQFQGQPMQGRPAQQQQQQQQPAHLQQFGADSGFPQELRDQVDRLSRVRGKHVKELGVPAGSGWLQRAGKGEIDTKAASDNEKIMKLFTAENRFFVVTYDQTEEANCVKSGNFDIECQVKCVQKVATDNLYCSIVFDYDVRSSIAQPHFKAVVCCPYDKVWRVIEYGEGRQVLLHEMSDRSLQPNGFSRLKVEIRGTMISVTVNSKALCKNLTMPDTNKALNRPVGIAVCKSRGDVKGWKLTAAPHMVGELSAAVNTTSDEFFGSDPALSAVIKRDILDRSPNVSFDDIAELGEAKRLLNEAIVLPSIMPEFFTGICEPWKGVLMFGPPGTGKTLLARAVATSGQTTFFNCSASSLLSKWHGESEKLVRCLFEMARFYAPSTIFMDEIDALASARGAQGEAEASRRLKSELLIQIDGIGSSSTPGQVMVLATTNRPWDLDEALRRRLEKRIYIPLPDEKARLSMLKINVRKVRMSSSMDLGKIAKQTENYSGADMHNLCRDACMNPMRRMILNRSPQEIKQLKAEGRLNLVEVNMADFEEALSKTQSSISVDRLHMYKKWESQFGSQ